MSTKSDIERSREEARRLMNYYSLPGVSRWTHHVHHKDLNPLNNDFHNLEVITIKKHRQIHGEIIHRRFQSLKPLIRKEFNTKCIFCNRKLVDNKCLCGRKQPDINKECYITGWLQIPESESLERSGD